MPSTPLNNLRNQIVGDAPTGTIGLSTSYLEGAIKDPSVAVDQIGRAHV